MKAKIKINRALCKKCGICAFTCPKQVYKFNTLKGPEVANSDDCIFCDMCIIMCPDMAIEISKNNNKGKDKK